MSSKTPQPRRLERFRKCKNKCKKVAGLTVQTAPVRTVASEARAANITNALAQTKKSNKHMLELQALDVAALKNKLAEVRKEYFSLRFKHATRQLENVASLGAHKCQIARILTLIAQKEVGA